MLVLKSLVYEHLQGRLVEKDASCRSNYSTLGVWCILEYHSGILDVKLILIRSLKHLVTSCQPHKVRLCMQLVPYSYLRIIYHNITKLPMILLLNCMLESNVLVTPQ